MSKIKKEIEGKIINLVFLAETNLECCKIFWKYIMEKKGGEYIKKNKKNRKKTRGNISSLSYKKEVSTTFFVQPMGCYFMLIFINHFFEVIFILTSLLWPTGKKEISFKLYFENKTIPSIDKLKKEFKAKKFVQMRQNIIAHKNFFEIEDISELKDVTASIIERKKIKELDEIIQKLKIEIYSLFKNSYFSTWKMLKYTHLKSKNDFDKRKNLIKLVEEIKKTENEQRKSLYKYLGKSQKLAIDNYCPIDYLQIQFGLKEILLLTDKSIPKDEEIFNNYIKKQILTSSTTRKSIEKKFNKLPVNYIFLKK